MDKLAKRKRRTRKGIGYKYLPRKNKKLNKTKRKIQVGMYALLFLLFLTGFDFVLFTIILAIIGVITLYFYVSFKKTQYIHIDLETENILRPQQIPEYTGVKNIALNRNKSGFDSEEILALKGQLRGNQFGFGRLRNSRPSYAVAILTPDNYNVDERESISTEPLGFHNNKLSDGSWAYNRSHLLAFSFVSGNTDIPQNIITGTREFNASRSWGMLKYEDIIRGYLKRSGDNYNPHNEIMYQVLPIYRINEAIPIGVQLRAKSLKGSNLDMNVFIYNVQDGLKVNYQNGFVREVS